MRETLGELCTKHLASVQRFKAHGGGPWFHLDLQRPEEDGGPNDVHHLSSSASCIESLNQVAPWLIEIDGTEAPDEGLLERFADLALARPPDEWKSEGGAYTYCRVRTLPVVVEKTSEDFLSPHAQSIADHIKFVWRDVPGTKRNEGIVEHSPDSALDDWASPKVGEETDVRPDAPQYPPNAFLTYWAIRLLSAAEYRGIVPHDSWADRKNLVLDWSRETLAEQVALHTVASEDADPHQLAWSISTVAAFGEPEDLHDPASSDLIKAGLMAFFSQQLPNGLWPRGQPLFHYPKSGNAYCYVFETLAELLRIAADNPGGVLQKLLRDHCDKLSVTARTADRTKEDLGETAVGWCSRHHPHRSYPESWATSGVFAFLEALRRLTGRWSSNEARRTLGARTPRTVLNRSPEDALNELGQSWPIDGWSIGDRLGAMFLNPLLSNGPEAQLMDADAPQIRKTQARSAILFGPPGTAKSSVVEVLAGALGWEFIEINVSAFLADGMDNVARRAEEIFNLVMELDRCVVLFDEIDELVRERRVDSSDPFGRFLTTSMLPKLAKLWSQRRILFFANTNLVEKTDPAIRRSQRFDASFFVLPPRLERKIELLEGILSPETLEQIRDADIDDQLRGENASGLMWLGLIRWDQMKELIAELSPMAPANLTQVEEALGRVGEQLSASDWHDPPGSIHKYFMELSTLARVDFGREQLARLINAKALLENDDHSLPEGYRVRGFVGEDAYVDIPRIDEPPDTLAIGSQLLAHRGLLRYQLTESI